MSALELIEAVEQVGGILRVAGDKLLCTLPREAAHLITALRTQKPAIVTILRQRGQTFTCRKCGDHFDTRIGLAAHQGYGCGNERTTKHGKGKWN